jgi:outer membrane protein assembly factor BamB
MPDLRGFRRCDDLSPPHREFHDLSLRAATSSRSWGFHKEGAIAMATAKAGNHRRATMRNAKTATIVGLALLLGAGIVCAGDWPQWRGPNRDNKVTGFTAPQTWPKELTQKWKAQVGLGDASPALVGDRIYVFTRQGDDEVIACLDAQSGKEVWHDKYATDKVTGAASGHPGPRSTPAVAKGKVCTFGVGGTLSCLDAATGKVSWRKETKAHPRFFTAASPIVVDGKCIAFLGGQGKGEIVAYDLASGEEKWKWTGEGPAYGSPVLMTVGDSKQLVTLTESSLIGVEVGNGKQLWKTVYKSRYNSCTPIIDGQTVICSSQPGGTVAFKIEKEGDGFTAKELWKKSHAAGIYNTPVLKDGLLYGLSPSPTAAAARMHQPPNNFFCMNAQTGEELWTDKALRGECGAVLDAGSVLLALTSDSNLVAFKPSNKEYTELAKIKVADTETWAYPIVAGNRIFVKDHESLIAWAID